MQSTLNISIKLGALREWVHNNREMAGNYAQMIDLRREPLSSCKIHALISSRRNHRETGCTEGWTPGQAFWYHTPRTLAQPWPPFTSNGSPLGWAMPVPLDGHIRPAGRAGRSLSEVDIADVLQELSKDPSGSIWSKLAYFSQCLDLGEKILERACEASASTALDVEQSERENKLGRLFDICLIAAAHRNKDLARSISAAALARAPRAVDGSSAMSILHILLLASAAFEHEDEWSSWIGEQLVGLAYNLPSGEATRVLREHLNEIKRVLPISSPVCSRADAVASAAN